MVITNKNSAEKVNRKLSIQVALNGLSFCCHNTLTQTITTLKEVDFSLNHKNESIESLLWKTFLQHDELTKAYDEIVVLYENNLNTFVPKPLFDEDYKGSYLQFNTKVFETDFFTFDPIDAYEMVNVFVPYVHINNFFVDQFSSFEFKHASSILVEKVLDYSKNNFEKSMYIHVSKNHFEIMVVQHQKLLLYNSFDFETPEDFVYYLLFTAEQQNLNPEQFKLNMMGDITEEHALYQLAYTYVRNVTILNLPFYNNFFTVVENNKHFTLLNA